MKKLLLSIGLLLVSICSYAQMNTFGGIGLRVNDTTTYQTNAASYHTAGYYDIYFNNQATNDHWDVWNGSSYDHIFSFGSGGGAGTPGGSDTQVQFNNSSAFGGDSDFTFTGGNTLNVDVAIVDTEAYDATGWNADNSVPTKDAVRDKIETISPLGKQDLFVPAGAFSPRGTDGCSTLTPFEMSTSLLTIQSLDFDQTTQEYAQFTMSLPRNWNNGTIEVTVYWTATSGSGTVQWDVNGGAYSNDDALTVAFGTVVEIDDTLLATNDLHVSPTSSAITLAGSPADADFLALQVSRDPSEDTLTGDAKLLGIRVTITLDSAVSE